MWSNSGTEDCGDYCRIDADNEIVLAATTDLSGFNLDVTVGASISGNISDVNGAISGAYVYVRDVDYDYGVGVTTDAMGDYIAPGLPADDYYVLSQDDQDIYINAVWASTGTAECVSCNPGPDSVIALSAIQVETGKDLVLTEGATLTGQITDSVSGDPVDTLQVRLFKPSDLNFNGFFYTQIDGLGNYNIQGIPQGDYVVYLEADSVEANDYVPEIYNNIQCNLCSLQVYNGAGDTVSLVNGATTSSIDFELETGASVSGYILNSEVMPPVPMTERSLVYLFDVSNRVVAVQFALGTNYDPLYTGYYRIGGLLPGSYFAQGGDQGTDFFQRELYNDIRCPWSGCDRGAGGTAINLGANEQRIGVDFDLEYGGKISGTVTDAITTNPIPSDTTQYVQFYDSLGQVAGGAGINPDGTYTSQRALPPGTYSARTGTMFNAEFNAPYVMEKYRPMPMGGNIDCPGVTCDLMTGNIVVTANNTVTGVDFALSTANSFSGTITEASPPNAPIPDVHVLVYDDNENFANWATTDAMGNFTVSGLPDGNYYARTNNGSNLPFMGIRAVEVGTWVDILFDGQLCPGSGCNLMDGDLIVLPTPPTINGVGSNNYNFSMPVAGTITGNISTFDSSAPGSFVNVQVHDENGLFLSSYASDENGDYLTSGLPDGTYYLTTQNDGALVDVSYGDAYCYIGSCDVQQAVPVVIVQGGSESGIDFELRTDFIFKSGLD